MVEKIRKPIYFVIDHIKYTSTLTFHKQYFSRYWCVNWRPTWGTNYTQYCHSVIMALESFKMFHKKNLKLFHVFTRPKYFFCENKLQLMHCFPEISFTPPELTLNVNLCLILKLYFLTFVSDLLGVVIRTVLKMLAC